MRVLGVLATTVVAAAVIHSLSGCVNVPAPQGPAYSASYIGDRAGQALEEMVLTVALQLDGRTELRNLHVRMDAIVNPKDVSLGSVYEVTDIIRRLEPRIRTHVNDLVPAGKAISLSSLAQLKAEVAAAAHATFMASYSKWTKASAYDVQIVVGAFYLTDLSVGAAVPARSWGHVF